MRKLLSLGLGMGIGSLVGAVGVLLFAPATGEKMRQYLRMGYRETLDEARAASQKRQLELTLELQRMQGRLASPDSLRLPSGRESSSS